MPEDLEFQHEEQYRVTARKWRPRIFSDVTSQQFITRTLKNSIKNNRISHAYLFCGPRGVGKTTVARILAKSLNCQNRTADGDPCNKCDSCKEIDDDNRSHPDVFEIDGASNRNIEDVRELKEKVKYGPIRSKYKIFIIDEVHMLTGPSFNALLKTLEEPPDYVVFIFATTAPEKVPLTILGRCQKFDFKRLSTEEIILRLKFIAEKENVSVDDESLFFMAKKGDGSMRDAQGLFDMSSVYCENDVTFDKLKEFFNLAEIDVFFNITDLIKSKDCSGILKYFDELMNRGYDMQSFLDGLTDHYRNLLVVISSNSADLIIESESIKQKYAEYINKFTQIEIINSLKLILHTEYSFKYSSNQRTLIEALLVELIKFTDTKDIAGILEELNNIKNDINKLDRPGISSLHSAKEDTFRNISISSAEVQDKEYPDKRKEIHEPGTRSISQGPEQTIQIRAEENRNINISSGAADINTHWVTIMDQIRTESKWVSSLLKDSSCELDHDNRNYYIKVNDSKFEILSSHKEYLRGKISTYFGEPLNLHLLKFSETSSIEPHSTGGNMQDSKKHENKKDNFDTICSILIENFNAKETRP